MLSILLRKPLIVYVTTQRLLEQVKEKYLVLGLTQENLIEFLGTMYLPYILMTVSLCSTTLAYSK